MSKLFPIVTVDSFSSVPFGGNPAAVCLVGTEDCLSDGEMQQIAAEMNISETAYITLLSSGDSYKENNRFGLRWFTPTTEVPLCGHATLASAAALFYTADNKNDAVEFITRESGSLFAKRCGDFISLDLPLNPPHPYENMEELSALIEAALGDIQPIDVQYAPEPMRKLLLRLPDTMTRQDLEKLSPAIDKFKSSISLPLIGVIITVKVPHRDTAASYDFLSRFFAPWTGINEDPVTGAAHTVLASYWSEQLGKTELYARQCSSRGGDVKIKVRKSEGRMDLAGPATVVLQGHINIGQ